MNWNGLLLPSRPAFPFHTRDETAEVVSVKVTFSPLSQVRDGIFNDLKQQRYAQWFDKLNREIKVTVNPVFVAPPEPAKK